MKRTIEAANVYAQEEARFVDRRYYPDYHAAPPVGWINDPCGFTEAFGKYHLYGQYHPYSSQWGPMHWGHWTSGDLVRWDWQGTALAPDTDADEGGCFTGTAQMNGEEMLAAYTGLEADGNGGYYQQQCVAVSRDGFHFEKSGRNPVIDRKMLPKGGSPVDFRDPCLFRWGDEWRLLATNRCEKGGTLLQFASHDGQHWEYRGVFLDGFKQMLECPNLIVQDGRALLILSVMDLPTEGRKYPHSNPSIVLWGTVDENAAHFSEEGRAALDNGWDYYAPQMMKSRDGRILMAGWMQAWAHRMPTDTLGHGWNGCMALVRELSWENGRLIQRPIREIEKYRGGKTEKAGGLEKGEAWKWAVPVCAEMTFCFRNVGEQTLRLSLLKDGEQEFRVEYDGGEQVLRVDATRSGYPTTGEKASESQMTAEADVPLRDGRLELRIFVDRCSVEIFIQGGEKVMSTRVFPKKPGREIVLSTSGEGCDAEAILYELNGERKSK